MPKLISGTYNAQAISFTKVADFKRWLETIPAGYHESVTNYRNGVINLRKKQETKT